jgi:tRNA nucleotidyltransferase/poly(A) polymerase
MQALEELKKLARQHKFEAYLTGGYVRDLVRKRAPKDVDVLVRGINFKHLIKLLSQVGSPREVGNTFGVILFTAYDGSRVEISLPRRARRVDKRTTLLVVDPNGTLLEDSRHRDFAMNAMFLPIGGKRKDIIDYHGGKADIRNRKIRAVGSARQRFIEDPVRMLRAFSLSARLGYRIDHRILHSARKLSRKIKESPAERIRDELNEILLSKKPSRQLRQLENIGLLKHVLPFVSRNVGVAQDKRFHKYDVFTHLLKACDNAPSYLLLRMAALLHDVGKYSVREEDGNRIKFHNHEMAGEIMTRSMLTNLLYPKEFIEDVSFLVRKHMYNYDRKWTDRAVRRFIREVGITDKNVKNLEGIHLFQLRIADRKGNGLKRDPVTQKQRDFEARLRKVYAESTALNIKDMKINGHDLMEKLDIPEGAGVGDLLEHLFEHVLEHPEDNKRGRLFELARSFIKNSSNT